MLEQLTIKDLTSSSLAENSRLAVVWAEASEQEKILEGSKIKRAQQKQLGRRAVEQALGNLSQEYSSFPVKRGPAGEPLWPKGVSGSLSHSKFLSIAVVSNSARIKTLGIDVQEMETPRSEAVFSRLFQASELAWVKSSGAFDMEKAFKFFCLKESAYKAVYSLNEHRLKSTEVSFESNGDEFDVSFSIAELNALATNAKATTYQGYAAAMLSFS